MERPRVCTVSGELISIETGVDLNAYGCLRAPCSASVASAPSAASAASATAASAASASESRDGDGVRRDEPLELRLKLRLIEKLESVLRVADSARFTTPGFFFCFC